MRKRTRDIFLRLANKLMTRLRAGRRLERIKAKLKADGIKSREDAKRMVEEDWRTAQNIRIVDNENEDNVRNIKFQFSFLKQNVGADQLKMPLEFETNIASFKETVEAAPPINFDDMAPFDFLEQLDFEVLKYTRFPIPAMSNYDPEELQKMHRPGCEFESVLRQRSGEPELEKKQLEAHKQKERVKAVEKEVVSGAIVGMPQTFLKPLNYSVNLLIKIHPTLRQFFKLHLCSEVDQISVFHFFYFGNIASKLSFQMFATNSCLPYRK